MNSNHHKPYEPEIKDYETFMLRRVAHTDKLGHPCLTGLSAVQKQIYEEKTVNSFLFAEASI